jgi:hypothetical protein
MINIFSLISVLLLLVSSCDMNNNNMSIIDKWDKEPLKGINISKADNGWYFLKIVYSAGFRIKVDTGNVGDSYFVATLEIKEAHDTIYLRNNQLVSPLFILKSDTCIKRFILSGFNPNSFASVDTSFTFKGSQVYECRLGNIYTKKYTDAIWGADLVFFITREKGILGMYISKDSKELFNDVFEEIIYYPKGEIFYKEHISKVNIIR